MAKFLKFSIAILTITVLASGYFFLFKKDAEMPVEKNNVVVQKNDELPTVEQKENENTEKLPVKKIPNNILIDVPFTSQSPFANWDEKHEEACEEASLLMLQYYLNKKPLTSQIAEDQIQKMIAFEIKNYGDYKDTTAAESIKLFNDFFGVPAGGERLKVVYDFKKEDLKKYLSQGRPIMVPAAGRMLGNPFFTPPGPWYHNLILTGYDGDAIITNDPGTKRGQGYKYDIDILYAAIHDFPGKPENIAQGRKAMIVLE